MTYVFEKDETSGDWWEQFSDSRIKVRVDSPSGGWRTEERPFVTSWSETHGRMSLDSGLLPVRAEGTHEFVWAHHASDTNPRDVYVATHPFLLRHSMATELDYAKVFDEDDPLNSMLERHREVDWTLEYRGNPDCNLPGIP